MDPTVQMSNKIPAEDTALRVLGAEPCALGAERCRALRADRAKLGAGLAQAAPGRGPEPPRRARRVLPRLLSQGSKPEV